MKKYQHILFDLDGTLSDPKEGITKCVQYALGKLGIVETDLDKLEPFIGPPLRDSFIEYYGLTEEEALKGIDFYRERFREIGKFENILYPEIPSLLQELKNSGKHLYVATSKPTVYSDEILVHFNIRQYFDLVVGSNLDNTRAEKDEVIQYLLESLSPDLDKSDFVMIGDRKFDMIGAQKNGIDSIGVTYGYGSKDELEQANATYIVDSIAQLKNILL